jgi:hypothetical protein
MRFDFFKNHNIYIFIFFCNLVFLPYLFIGLPTTITIYGENKHSNLLQVYFSESGKYSEINSIAGKFGGGINEVKIKIPGAHHKLRIDPSAEAGEIDISKIEINNLFLKDVYEAEKLSKHIHALMMIDKIKVLPTSLRISSSGNDPAFLFEPKPSISKILYQLIGIEAIIFFISLFLNILLLKTTIIKNVKESSNYFKNLLTALIISFFITAAITLVFYPGFMSYDSLHALRGARVGILDSMWPPMVSYIWRLVDFLSIDTYAMLFIQVYVLITALFYVIYNQSKNIFWTIIPICIYLMQPYILGSIAVIWKDVLTASFLIGSLALTIPFKKSLEDKNLINSIIYLILILFFIILGVTTRHNSIAGSLPILYYVSILILSYSDKKINRLKHLIYSLTLSLFLILTVYAPKVILDNYALPSLTKIESPANIFLRNVQLLDLAGASLCAQKNLFADLAPNLTIAEIQKQYDPRHINLSASIVNIASSSDDVSSLWKSMISEYPSCALYNKYHMTKYLIGMHSGPQFLITHPYIDKNEYSIDLGKSQLREKLVNYIYKYSSLYLFKPWIIIVLSTILVLWFTVFYFRDNFYLIIQSSGLLYFFGIILLGNASDARLLFYSNTLFILNIILIIIKIIKFNPTTKNLKHFKGARL